MVQGAAPGAAAAALTCAAPELILLRHTPLPWDGCAGAPVLHPAATPDLAALCVPRSPGDDLWTILVNSKSCFAAQNMPFLGTFLQGGQQHSKELCLMHSVPRLQVELPLLCPLCAQLMARSSLLCSQEIVTEL